MCAVEPQESTGKCLKSEWSFYTISLSSQRVDWRLRCSSYISCNHLHDCSGPPQQKRVNILIKIYLDTHLKSERSESNFRKTVNTLFYMAIAMTKFSYGMKMKWKLAMVPAIEEIPDRPRLHPSTMFPGVKFSLLFILCSIFTTNFLSICH